MIFYKTSDDKSIIPQSYPISSEYPQKGNYRGRILQINER